MLIQVNIRRVKKLGVAVLKSGRGSDITLQNHNSRFSQSHLAIWHSASGLRLGINTNAVNVIVILFIGRDCTQKEFQCLN